MNGLVSLAGSKHSWNTLSSGRGHTAVRDYILNIRPDNSFTLLIKSCQELDYEILIIILLLFLVLEVTYQELE